MSVHLFCLKFTQYLSALLSFTKQYKMKQSIYILRYQCSPDLPDHLDALLQVGVLITWKTFAVVEDAPTWIAKDQ